MCYWAPSAYWICCVCAVSYPIMTVLTYTVGHTVSIVFKYGECAVGASWAVSRGVGPGDGSAYRSYSCSLSRARRLKCCPSSETRKCLCCPPWIPFRVGTANRSCFVFSWTLQHVLSGPARAVFYAGICIHCVGLVHVVTCLAQHVLMLRSFLFDVLSGLTATVGRTYCRVERSRVGVIRTRHAYYVLVTCGFFCYVLTWHTQPVFARSHTVLLPYTYAVVSRYGFAYSVATFCARTFYSHV